MKRKTASRKFSTRAQKGFKYALGQLMASLPNDTKRRNRDVEFCLVVAGAHKVGSTWVYKMVKDLHTFREWPVPLAYRTNRKNVGLIDLHKDGVDEYFRKTNGLRLYKSHSEPPHWDPGNKVKFISVIRDPRDIVVSNIFYLTNLAPQLGGWPELKNMSLQERVGVYLKKGVFDLALLEKWSDYAPSRRIYYEDLLQSPEAVMSNLFDELNLKVSDSECHRVVKGNAFARLSGGRKEGQEDTGSFFRKGVAGDWRNYFGEKETETFKLAQDGRWNRLLIRLGYETIEDWQ